MRFIHTADWHLGRIFHGVHLTSEQEVLLDQFVDLVRDARPEVVVIAGDLYDRAVPPPDAVMLLDDVLGRLVDLGTTVAIIAGNHDSPDRLSYGAKLFEKHNVHVSCHLSQKPKPLVIRDAHGPVWFHLVPFAEPPVVRAHTGNDSIQNHAAAIGALVDEARGRHPKDDRSVLVAHATITGARLSDSERPLGPFSHTSAVDADRLQGFDFVALGHLHTRQTIGHKIHYPGSLMKYSFGEAEETKAVSLVEMDARGGVRIEDIHLSPRRQVRKIRGHLDDLLKADDGKNRDDFVMAVLYDEGALFDPIARLRDVYPNVLQIERTALDLAEPLAERVDHRKRSHLEIFGDFFQEVTGGDLSEEEMAAMMKVLSDLSLEEREVRL